VAHEYIDDDDDDENEEEENFGDDDVEQSSYTPELTTDSVILDFAVINNERCLALTGITKTQFFDVWSYIKDFEYQCKMSSINGLGFFLTRLRTGNSLKKLSHLIPIGSYYQVQQIEMSCFFNIN
jgi:hypothetical protein